MYDKATGERCSSVSTVPAPSTCVAPTPDGAPAGTSSSSDTSSATGATRCCSTIAPAVRRTSSASMAQATSIWTRQTRVGARAGTGWCPAASCGNANERGLAVRPWRKLRRDRGVRRGREFPLALGRSIPSGRTGAARWREISWTQSSSRSCDTATNPGLTATSWAFARPTMDVVAGDWSQPWDLLVAGRFKGTSPHGVILYTASHGSAEMFGLERTETSPACRTSPVGAVPGRSRRRAVPG